MGKLKEALYRRNEEFSDELIDRVDSLEVLAEMMGCVLRVEYDVYSSETHIYFEDARKAHALVLLRRRAYIKKNATLVSMIRVMADESEGFEVSLLRCIEEIEKLL